MIEFHSFQMEDINVTGLIIVLCHASLVSDGDDAYHSIILPNIVMETSRDCKGWVNLRW